jgi:hypothetical protein
MMKAMTRKNTNHKRIIGSIVVLLVMKGGYEANFSVQPELPR